MIRKMIVLSSVGSQKENLPSRQVKSSTPLTCEHAMAIPTAKVKADIVVSKPMMMPGCIGSWKRSVTKRAIIDQRPEIPSWISTVRLAAFSSLVESRVAWRWRVYSPQWRLVDQMRRLTHLLIFRVLLLRTMLSRLHQLCRWGLWGLWGLRGSCFVCWTFWL